MKVLLVIFSMVLGLGVEALAQSKAGELPEQAKKVVASLPGNAVSLDLVVALAMRNSDSFRAANAQAIAKEAPRLRAEQAFAPVLTGSYTRLNDQLQTVGAFSPEEAELESWEVGVAKNFATGTRLEAEYSNNNNDLVFQNQSVPSTLLPPSNYSQSLVSLSLTQSLVKDFLGSTSKKRLASARLQSQALGYQHQEAVEQWHEALVQLFYGAWLAQQQYEAAQQNLAAQKRVLRVTRVQHRRGTAEARQLLQLQGAETSAIYQVTSAEQELWNIWRDLVETLKLPPSWADIHPSLVPMTLQDPSERIEGRCEVALKGQPPEAKDASVLRAQAQVSAMDLQVEADKNQFGPEAFLRADLAANGIGNNADEARTESLSVDNPRWGVTLGVSWTLGQQAEKAQLLADLAQKTLAEAELAMLSGQNRVAWINGCRNLQRLKAQIAELKKVVERQERRVGLEEREFGIGRLPALNILQAILDLTQAQLTYASAQAELRREAWSLFRLTNELPEYLKSLAERNYSLDTSNE